MKFGLILSCTVQPQSFENYYNILKNSYLSCLVVFCLTSMVDLINTEIINVFELLLKKMIVLAVEIIRLKPT